MKAESSYVVVMRHRGCYVLLYTSVSKEMHSATSYRPCIWLLISISCLPLPLMLLVATAARDLLPYLLIPVSHAMIIIFCLLSSVNAICCPLRDSISSSSVFIDIIYSCTQSIHFTSAANKWCDKLIWTQFYPITYEPIFGNMCI